MTEKRLSPHFTLEEARQLLEQLRPLVEQMLRLRSSLLEKHPELLPVLKKIAGNGGSQTASVMVEEFRQLEALITQIQATGVLVKDINTGLLDFPSWREGKEMVLCWQFNEKTILFWHDIDAGFANRQPI